MQTVVELDNSNCSWCLNMMATRLVARPLVRRVHLDARAGCLVVEHDHDDPAALVAEIHHDLRGWEAADNGEAVMVDLGVHEESECRWAPTTAEHQAGVERQQSSQNLENDGKAHGRD